MTEPSVEASRPTMMTVQASKALSISADGSGAARSARVSPPAAKNAAATARIAGNDLLRTIVNTSRRGSGGAPFN